MFLKDYDVAGKMREDSPTKIKHISNYLKICKKRKKER
jgi:hypothetical protein